MRDVAGIPGSCLASRGAASVEGDKNKNPEYWGNVTVS